MTGPRSTTLLDVCEAIVNQITDEVIDDAIERRASLVTSGDQAQQSKDRQLMAQRRHREAQRARNVTDRHLVVSQRVHDSDPVGIGECLEYLARVLHGIVNRQTRGSPFDLARVARGRQWRLGDRHAARLATPALVGRVIS